MTQTATRHAIEQAIARDLEQCSAILAYGARAAKAKARKHRKACYAAIQQWNVEDGNALSDDDLAAQLLEVGFS